MLRRREFLHRCVAAGAALFARKFSSPLFASPSASDSRIEIVLDEPLGSISPNIYGHFTENLGGVIYDGIWVGEDSKIPNVNGVRKELIDEMRLIKPPVVRYPGGCFADSYDWRDGIGPRDKRPRRTNFWAGEERRRPRLRSRRLVRTPPRRPAHGIPHQRPLANHGRE